MQSIPNLDKLTEAQREGVAADLLARAQAHEAEADSMDRRLEQIVREREQLTARAYHLRRLAHAVRNFTPLPKVG